MFERRDTGEPMHACTYMYVFADQSANLISSRSDYSRAASISFRACSGAATIRERRLFQRGVYSVIYGICSVQLLFWQHQPGHKFHTPVHGLRRGHFTYTEKELLLELSRMDIGPY